MTRRAVQDAILLTFWQAVLLLVLGGAGVYANTSCSVDCDSGGSVSCGVTGTGCECSADAWGGCSASCTGGCSPNCEDAHQCRPILM